MTQQSSSPDPGPFRHRIRVRYSEIDGQSVVFNSRYLEYADVAITEYFRAHGISIVPGSGTPEFHVAKATVEFKSPIRIDEEIDLYVRTERLGRSSWTIRVEIRGAAKNDPRANIEEIYVHVDLRSGAPAPIPGWIRAAIEGTEGVIAI
ncbi:MAG TPA: thioesterase family protein [Steroidobacteraceae bacterium]